MDFMATIVENWQFVSDVVRFVAEEIENSNKTKNLSTEEAIDGGYLEQILKKYAAQTLKGYPSTNASNTKATRHATNTEGKDAQGLSFLPVIASLPSTEIQQFFFRIMSSSGELKKSTVTRSEEISIEEYMESGTSYTRYRRRNRDKEVAILFSDAEEILTGRNKTFLKLFIFSMQKIAQQNNPRAVHFSLSELVQNKMYSSTDTARRAVKAFYSQQSKVQFFRSTKDKESGGFLFYHRDIDRGYVTLFINENLPIVPIFAEQYTVFPRWAYRLGSNAFSLTHYIFALARQNAKKISETGTFNVGMEAIRNYLGLPTVNELSLTSRHYDFITEPIESAIEEIEEAVRETREEYNGNFTITPNTVEGMNIREWLDGYITIGLSGDYVKSLERISDKRRKMIETHSLEKAKEAARIAARAESKTKKGPCKKQV